MLSIDRCLAMVLTAVLLSGCVSTGSSGVNRAGETSQARQAAQLQVKLGQEYMQQGNLRVALERLQRALSLDPRFPDAHTVIAVLYERIGDPEKAGVHYRRAVELAPEDGTVLNNLGTYLCGNEKYAESESYFLKALSDPFYDTPDVSMTNAGLCARLAGNDERAEEYLRAALDIRATNATAIYELASLMHRRGDNFTARAFIQRYEAAQEPTSEALALAAYIERANGNSSDAAAYETRLLARYPDSPQALQLREAQNP